MNLMTTDDLEIMSKIRNLFLIIYWFIKARILRLPPYLKTLLNKIARLPAPYLRTHELPIKSHWPKGIKKILIFAYTPSDSQAELSIKRNLETLGYTAEIFSPTTNLKPWENDSLTLHQGCRYYTVPDLGHRLMNRRLLNKVLREKFDLLFVLESNWGLLPETLIEIKKRCHTFIAIWETNLHLWTKHQADCLPFYDFVFSLDSYLLPLLKTANVKYGFLMPACVDEKLNFMPRISRFDQARYACDLGFVGRLYPNRVKLFEYLTSYDLKIFGPKMPETSISPQLAKKVVAKSISLKEKRKFYKLAKISLDFQSDALHINSPNIRPLEIAACGGFPLVGYKKDLELMFKVGKEIICFKDEKELIQKINYYLHHPKQRQIISEHCRKKILKAHTFAIRLKQMLKMIETKRPIWERTFAP